MLDKYINNYENIVITSHINPDGDAIGSSLAMYLALKQLDKNVDIILDEYPKTFDFLPSTNKIQKTSTKKYDLAIILDTSSLERASHPDIIKQSKFTLCIDHHQSNTLFCNANFIYEKTPATCEILYYLFKETNIKVTKEIATCLITGLITDTNALKYGIITDKTYEMEKEIYNLEVDITSIINKIIDKRSIPSFNLLKESLNRLELLLEGKVSFTYITKEDIKKYNAQLGDHEGIIEIGRNIENVEVAILVKEEDDSYKVSLRSNKYVDVSKIAKKNNGGGHIHAAAFTTKMSIKEIKEKLEYEMKEYL